MDLNQSYSQSYIHAHGERPIYYRAWLIDLRILNKDTRDSIGRHTGSLSQLHPPELEANYTELWNGLEAIEKVLTSTDSKSGSRVDVWTWWRERLPCRRKSAQGASTTPQSQSQGTVDSTMDERLTLWAFAFDQPTREYLEQLRLPIIAGPGPRGEIGFDKIYPTRYRGQALEPTSSCEGPYYLFCLAMKRSLARQMQTSLSASGYQAAEWSHGTSLLLSPIQSSDTREDVKPCLKMSFLVQVQPDSILIETDVRTTTLNFLADMSLVERANMIGKYIVLAPTMTRALLIETQTGDLDTFSEQRQMVTVSISSQAVKLASNTDSDVRKSTISWPMKSCLVEEDVLKSVHTEAQVARIGMSVYTPPPTVMAEVPAINFDLLDRQMAEASDPETMSPKQGHTRITDDGDDTSDYDGPGMTEDDFSFFDSAPALRQDGSFTRDELFQTQAGMRHGSDDGSRTNLGLAGGPNDLRKSRNAVSTFTHGPAGPTPGKTPGTQDVSPHHLPSPHLEAIYTGDAGHQSTGVPSIIGHDDAQILLNVVPSNPLAQPTPRSMPADTPRSADNEIFNTSTLVTSHDTGDKGRPPLLSTYRALPIDSEWSDRAMKYRSTSISEVPREESSYHPGKSDSPNELKRKRDDLSEHERSRPSKDTTAAPYRAPLTPMSNGNGLDSSDEESEYDDQSHEDTDALIEIRQEEYRNALAKALRSAWPIGSRRPLPIDDQEWLVGVLTPDQSGFWNTLTSSITADDRFIPWHFERQEKSFVDRPRITVSRKGDILQMDANALQHWIPLELSPIGDAKQIVTLLLVDHSLTEIADDELVNWLESMGSIYTNMNLGRHLAISSTSPRKSLPRIDTSRPPSANQVLSDYSASLAEQVQMLSSRSNEACRSEVVLFFIVPDRYKNICEYDKWLEKYQIGLEVPFSCKAHRLESHRMKLPWTKMEYQSLALDIFRSASKPADCQSAMLIDPPAMPKITFEVETGARRKSLDVLHRDYMLFVDYRVESGPSIHVKYCDQRGELSDEFVLELQSRHDLDFRPDYSWLAKVVAKLSEVCETIDLDWHVVLCKQGTMGRKELHEWMTNFRQHNKSGIFDGLSVMCSTRLPLADLKTHAKADPQRAWPSSRYDPESSIFVTKDTSLLPIAREEKLSEVLDITGPHVGLMALTEGNMTTTLPDEIRACKFHLLVSDFRQNANIDSSVKMDTKSDSNENMNRKILRSIMERLGHLNYVNSLLQKPSLIGPS